MSAVPPFNARLISTWSFDRLYRVYIDNNDICFVRIGGQGGARRGAAAQFGLLGGLVLGYFDKRAASRLGDKVRDLDSRDPRKRVGHHKHDFRVSLVELESSEIRPAAMIGGHGPHAGRWVITPRNRKPLTLQLETVADMKAAVEELEQSLGGRHHNTVVWNADTGRFVKRAA